MKQEFASRFAVWNLQTTNLENKIRWRCGQWNHLVPRSRTGATHQCQSNVVHPSTTTGGNKYGCLRGICVVLIRLTLGEL